MKKVAILIGLCFCCVELRGDWFEEFKRNSSDAELHQFLYEMPKGGDLHHHLTGSIFSEDWYELAIASSEFGYLYFTKVAINNCRRYGDIGFDQYLIHYRNISENNWEKLSECEKSEYLPLAEMNDRQLEDWSNAIRLDKKHEGRNEFFERHWQRLGDLLTDPYIMKGISLKNLQHLADEGLLYAEPQVPVAGWVKPDGTPIGSSDAAQLLRDALDEPDFKETGMTWRFQLSILRMLPTAEEQLIEAYKFVTANNPWVAVNMVGREDDDKGYPLRFLPTFRELRHKYGNVHLSIHGGEVDEPNSHVRDTLLLGADRIGHGINLITDPDTMRLMRHGPYLVEINLISNLLLEYVSDYSEHPFPEYLRTGIPVALSTDDRGMWDSTMTDEFFVAVKEFNLSWNEIKLLSENSLKYAFLDSETKEELLKRYRSNIFAFEEKVRSDAAGVGGLRIAPKRGFICRQYDICAP